MLTVDLGDIDIDLERLDKIIYNKTFWQQDP